MIKAVILDMDGLMIDSEPLVSKSFELLIKEYGKEPIFEKNGLIHRVGLGKIAIDMIKKKHGIKEKVDILRIRRREIYYEILKKEKIKPMPGLVKLLKLLRKKKFKIALASNSHLKNIVNILKTLKIAKYFQVIISGENVKRYKPYPDIYLEASKRLKVNPESCLVFEDSAFGVTAAKKAKMKVVAVPNIYTKDSYFEKTDLTVNTLNDLTWGKLSVLMAI